MGELTRAGERELCTQLRKETFEIEETHRRRSERAARIAELQGTASPMLHAARVDLDTTNDKSASPASRRRGSRAERPISFRYSFAELYLNLRDRLDERVARADAEPSPVKPPIQLETPTYVQAMVRPAAFLFNYFAANQSRAQGMTRRDVGRTLKTHHLALGSDWHPAAGFDAPSRAESRANSSSKPSRRPSLDG